MLKPIGLLAFDMDGVLADTSPCHAEAYDQLWSYIGINGPDYANIAGRTTREVVTAHTNHLEPNSSDIDAWVHYKQVTARELLKTASFVFSDTLPLIQQLYNEGYELMVVTGASRQSAEIILQTGGIRDYFTDLICAEDVVSGKPDPEGYQLAIQRSAYKNEETLIIEDSFSGIQAALACNAWVVSVRSNITSHDSSFVFDASDLADLGRRFSNHFKKAVPQ